MKKLTSYIDLLRPHQWLKSLLILFPPFFAGKISDKSVLIAAPLSLIAFSLMASSSYIINDIRDCDADKIHPDKRNRCIPRGDVSVFSASFFSIILMIASLSVSFMVSKWYWSYLSAYFLISLLYTFYLKHIVIIDIFAIAAGFLIRVLSGGEAFNITVTSWLFLTVFIVALFLAAGKRLGEMISQGEDALRHRMSLNFYSQSFLEGILWSSASSALVMYALYVIENRQGMIYTVPLVAFGLLRYIYIVKEGKGDPTEALLKDGQIMVTGVVWAVMIGIIIYK